MAVVRVKWAPNTARILGRESDKFEDVVVDITPVRDASGDTHVYRLTRGDNVVAKFGGRDVDVLTVQDVDEDEDDA